MQVLWYNCTPLYFLEVTNPIFNFLCFSHLLVTKFSLIYKYINTFEQIITLNSFRFYGDLQHFEQICNKIKKYQKPPQIRLLIIWSLVRSQVPEPLQNPLNIAFVALSRNTLSLHENHFGSLLVTMFSVWYFQYQDQGNNQIYQFYSK